MVCVGVIPDGNRRYARKMGISFEEAYRRGVENVRLCAEVFFEKGADCIVFYSLSLDNLRKRNEHEISTLFSLMERAVDEYLRGDFLEDTRVEFAGRLDLLPPRLVERFREVERRGEGERRVVFLVAYGGRDEIISAVNRAVEMRRPVDEETFRSLLWARVPDPDFILRTSGEYRLSGFLTYHSPYSELIFYPKLWPEMEREDFEKVWTDYERRERRFGR